MAEPCRQEPRLKYMENELADTVREIRDDQKRQIKYLESIARQSVRLEALEAGQARHEKAIGSLFERSREYDRLPGAMAMRLLLLAATVGSGTLTGVLVWAITRNG